MPDGFDPSEKYQSQIPAIQTLLALGFQPVFIPKAANASGLQLADLTARPIALSRLRPGQPNRAFKIIEPKLGGLKCFP